MAQYNMNEIPSIELFDLGSLNNVALVTDPAIDELFVALSKEEIQLKVANEEKKIVCGPALIPNKNILRYNASEEPFYIYFSEDTVRHISEEFLKDGKTHAFNLQHQDDTEDLYITESWIVENPAFDKSKALGMDLPAGTWMLSAKVANDSIWERVKNGELRGFSIDGLFTTERRDVDEELLNKVIDVLNNVE